MAQGEMVAFHLSGQVGSCAGEHFGYSPPPNRDGACSSVGEHFVDIEGVASSILATPTISALLKIQASSAVRCHLPYCA